MGWSASDSPRLNELLFIRFEAMKYAEEKRIRFIDYLLSQYGYFNRSAIVNFFAIAPSQVTKDIATYKKIAPDNLFFNDSEKLYYKTNSFKPLYK